jgi:hypothetical protein
MIPVLFAVAFVSCKASQEVQVDLLSAELIRIDTVYRYPAYQQALTWRCENNIDFVSITDLKQPYKLGSRYKVLFRR